MSENKRLLTYEKIDYKFDWSYGADIKDIKKDIEEMEKLGATYVEIEIETRYDEDSIFFTAFKRQPETDEQYEQRMTYVEERRKEREHQERELLKALKLKYESGDE